MSIIRQDYGTLGTSQYVELARAEGGQLYSQQLEILDNVLSTLSEEEQLKCRIVSNNSIYNIVRYGSISRIFVSISTTSNGLAIYYSFMRLHDHKMYFINHDISNNTETMTDYSEQGDTSYLSLQMLV